MSPGCVFCSIVAGRAPAAVVFRDEVAIGFLDVHPLFVGHVLVAPLEHHETLTDLPPEVVGPLYLRVRAVADAVVEALDAHGTFVAQNNVVSQSVPHVHVHVVPRRFKDGLRGFFWPRTRYESDVEAAAVAEQLADAYRPPTPFTPPLPWTAGHEGDP